MPSFRSPERQAREVAAMRSDHGSSRHENRDDGRIHSVGTERSYRDALAGAARWMHDQGHMQGLAHMSAEQAQAYLVERAGDVQQPTLDRDRQALQVAIEARLEHVKSEVQAHGLAQQGRGYTPAQVREIALHQGGRHALATAIAHAAGLRAHELATLRPASEQPASDHREWSPDRFTGREGDRYTVTGKGGLVREVSIPPALAQRLEARRFDAPQQITDRGVHYRQYYDIGAGKAWSRSFTEASQRALEYSTGAHGLRHSYAQQRLGEVQAQGRSYEQALAVVSQELGHFRPEITETYLR